jgi:hypothetical protein
MYVTFLRLGGEPVWECVHRVQKATPATVATAAGVYHQQKELANE